MQLYKALPGGHFSMIASKSVTNIVSMDHFWVFFLIHHLSYHLHVWIHCVQNSYRYHHVRIFSAPCPLLTRSIDSNTTMYSSGMISGKSAPRRGAVKEQVLILSDGGYKSCIGSPRWSNLSGVLATAVTSKKLRKMLIFMMPGKLNLDLRNL